MVRKIRKIKRVKKKPKVYNFSDDTKILSSNMTYRKTFVLFILVASFLVVQLQVFSPTQNLVDSFRSDYESKEALIQNGNKVKKGLIVQAKKFKDEYKELKNIFFKIGKSHEFFTLIANSAVNNQLKIVAIQKVNEEPFKLPKKGSDPNAKPEMIEYDYFPDFTTASFKIDFEGSYVNYMDFINDIKEENKSLVVDDSIISKKEGNLLSIKSTLSINYTNSDA